MRAVARWLLLAATAVLLLVALLLPGRSHERRTVVASGAQAVTGTVEAAGRVLVRELPEPRRTGAAAARASTPRRAVPLLRSAGQPPRPNVTLGDAASSSGRRTPPDVSSLQFEGLDTDDNPFGDITPPDPQIAVGPDHVVEMVNITGRVFDKAGNILQTFDLADFFFVPEGFFHADPKLLYDAFSGRWFAAYISFYDYIFFEDEARLHVATSETSDPTGEWAVYSIPYAEVFADYPGLGVTNDKVTVSVNVFDIDWPLDSVAPGCSFFTGFCGERTIVFEKSDLLAGSDEATISSFPLDPDSFTVRPAHSLSSTADQYLATWAAEDELSIVRISGTPDAGSTDRTVLASLPTQLNLPPPPSTTAGGGGCIIVGDSGLEDIGPPPCIDSGDGRLLDAVWRDGRLWAASSAECLPDGDVGTRSCAHLIEVETVGTPSVTQDILFGGPAGHYWSWPAIRTDSSGNLHVVLTHTSEDHFAEASVAGRLASDPPNTMSGSALLRAGEVVHTSGRWGDYLGAAVDPSDPSCVWVVGEYAKETSGADWGTYIAAVSYEDACGGGPVPTLTPSSTPTYAPVTPLATPSPAATDGPTATATSTDTYTPTYTPTFTPTRTRTPTRTPTPTPAGVRGDASCDGRTNAVDAALILQLDAGLIAALPCPQNGDVSGDDRTNAVDAALVLQYDAGILDELPA
jgi:hypothetical protein